MFSIEKPLVAILLVLAAFAPAVLSLAFAARGQDRGRRVSIGGALLGVGILLAAVITVFLSAADGGRLPVEIARAWILPRQADNELSIGVLMDTAAFSIVVYSCFVFAVFLLAQLRSEKNHAGVSRTLIAAGLSVSGVALAWLSISHWLSLAGQVVAGAGAALYIAAWPPQAGEDESAEVGNFLVERAAVLLLGVLGGCALLASGHAPSWSASAGFESVGSRVSEWLLVLGQALILFSCILSLLSPVRVFHSARSRVRYSGIGIPAALVGPALASFAPVFRLQPLFSRQEGVIGAFVLIASAALIMVALHAITLSVADRMILPMVTAASLVPFLALATGGVAECVTLLFGWVAAVSIWGLLSERLDGFSVGANDWVRKALLMLPALALVGAPGFATAGTIGSWLSSFVSQIGPHFLVLLMVALAAFGAQLWVFVATSWREPKGDSLTALGASDLIPAILILLPATGPFWTGSVSGGLIDQGVDRLFGSLLEGILQSTRLWGQGSSPHMIEALDRAGALALGSWLILQLLLAAFSFWSAGTGEQGRRAQWLARFPRLRDFIRQGMFIPGATNHIRSALERSGRALHDGVTQVLWFRGVSSVSGRTSATISLAAGRADRMMVQFVTNAVRSGARGASEGLRRIQSGDVQWYVLFGVGGGLFVLLTFFRLVKS